MKIELKELYNIADVKRYPVDVKLIKFENNIFINAIKDVTGDIMFYYDNGQLVIDYSIKGYMVCPDSYTLEDVELEFNLENDEDVTLSEDKDGFLIRDKEDISEIIKTIVLPEVPLKVEK